MNQALAYTLAAARQDLEPKAKLRREEARERVVRKAARSATSCITGIRALAVILWSPWLALAGGSAKLTLKR